MKRFRQSRAHALAALVAAIAAADAGCGGAKAAGNGASGRIVVYTRTIGFRHNSIPAALAAMRDMAAREHLEVVATEDPAAFRPDPLRGVSAVVFLHTT
ncbi:MAG TPA: ThuA domain-containing protein, partial [Myxococcales bacterium]|nr:ThuA domain-containing protein [Myxococcales bacterium]